MPLKISGDEKSSLLGEFLPLKMLRKMIDRYIKDKPTAQAYPKLKFPNYAWFSLGEIKELLEANNLNLTDTQHLKNNGLKINFAAHGKIDDEIMDLPIDPKTGKPMKGYEDSMTTILVLTETKDGVRRDLLNTGNAVSVASINPDGGAGYNHNTICPPTCQ